MRIKETNDREESDTKSARQSGGKKERKRNREGAILEKGSMNNIES